MSLSKHNSAVTIEKLRFEPENKYLERKGRATKPTKIANELIGMLNAGGGVLVYGISDDGTIEDVAKEGDLFPDRPAKLDAYRTLVDDLIEPPANIRLEEVLLETGELIFLYHVDQDYERLFQRKDSEAVYLRVGEENRSQNREEVKHLEYNKTIRSFEDDLREDFNTEDLNIDLCSAYLTAMNYQGGFEDLAVNRSLAKRQEGRVLYKNVAVLLFANNPENYIPNASVRYVRYRGNEKHSGAAFNVVKDQRFEGGIPEVLEKLESFIDASLRDYYYLDMEKGKFVKVPEFPREAWFEGLVNALCHRSYNIQGNPIHIFHFDDRLEISNSGPLPAQVTVENIARERFSRNPRVARCLVELGYVRELNEGVPRIYSAMRDFMLAKPIYKNENLTVTLILKNKVSEHKETILGEVLKNIEGFWLSLNDSQQKIIHLIVDYQEVTVPLLAKEIGIHAPAVRYNLKKLEEIGITERVSKKTRDPDAIYRFKSG